MGNSTKRKRRPQTRRTKNDFGLGQDIKRMPELKVAGGEGVRYDSAENGVNLYNTGADYIQVGTLPWTVNLAQWMNQARGTSSLRRVLLVWRTGLRVSTKLKTDGGMHWYRYQRATRRAREALRQYSFSPNFDFGTLAPFQLEHIDAPGSPVTFLDVEEYYGEGRAILDVLRLLNENPTGIRRCELCDKWFGRKSRIQRFCSTACQQANSTKRYKTATYNERQRLNMAKNRKAKKDVENAKLRSKDSPNGRR
jgi:hypothetical protein